MFTLDEGVMTYGSGLCRMNSMSLSSVSVPFTPDIGCGYALVQNARGVSLRINLEDVLQMRLKCG